MIMQIAQLLNLITKQEALEIRKQFVKEIEENLNL